eukprot:Nk52_evm11s2256 gene=Nk52_evmTU11s2256
MRFVKGVIVIVLVLVASHFFVNEYILNKGKEVSTDEKVAVIKDKVKNEEALSDAEIELVKKKSSEVERNSGGFNVVEKFKVLTDEEALDYSKPLFVGNEKIIPSIKKQKWDPGMNEFTNYSHFAPYQEKINIMQILKPPVPAGTYSEYAEV